MLMTFRWGNNEVNVSKFWPNTAANIIQGSSPIASFWGQKKNVLVEIITLLEDFGTTLSKDIEK